MDARRAHCHIGEVILSFTLLLTVFVRNVTFWMLRHEDQIVCLSPLEHLFNHILLNKKLSGTKKLSWQRRLKSWSRATRRGRVRRRSPETKRQRPPVTRLSPSLHHITAIISCQMTMRLYARYINILLLIIPFLSLILLSLLTNKKILILL